MVAACLAYKMDEPSVLSETGLVEPGDDLLSHTSGGALPSAAAFLTFVFGKGTSVSMRP